MQRLYFLYFIKIFTPEKEIPFAGHPTIGTAHILRETGQVISGDHSIKLSMKAGIITVTQGLIDNLHRKFNAVIT